MRTKWRAAVSRGMRPLAIALVVALVAVEASWYLAPPIHERFWRDVFDRGAGPMTFQFFLQPAMSVAFALYDGVHDVRLARRTGASAQETGLESQGVTSIARIVLLGLIMDLIYQMRVLGTFYPAEALIVTIPLVSLPYFAVRRIVKTVGERTLPRF